jgi:hypothetical protein
MQCNISTRYVEALLVVAPCTTPSSAPCLPVTPFWIHQSQPLAPLFLLLLLLTPPPPSPAGGRSLEWTMEEDMGGPIRLRTLLARKVGGLCFSFILGRWVCVWGGGGGGFLRGGAGRAGEEGVTSSPAVNSFSCTLLVLSCLALHPDGAAHCSGLFLLLLWPQSHLLLPSCHLGC